MLQPVWNPNTTTDVSLLEQVQRNAARFVTSNYRNTASTTEMVKSLGLDTLGNRRLFHQLLIFYNIRHSIVNISFPLSIRENSRPSRRSGVKHIQLPASVNAFGMSFLPRTIRAWNLLPGVVTASPSLLAFKVAALPAVRSMQAPGHMRRLQQARATSPSISASYIRVKTLRL